MKYIKLYENIDWDDWDEQEYDNDISEKIFSYLKKYKRSNKYKICLVYGHSESNTDIIINAGRYYKNLWLDGIPLMYYGSGKWGRSIAKIDLNEDDIDGLRSGEDVISNRMISDDGERIRTNWTLHQLIDELKIYEKRFYHELLNS